MRSSPGSICFASANAVSTGGKQPCPTMCGGCFSGSARSRPTPDANGSATSVKRCLTLPSRLLFATACIDGVLDVMTRSKPPAVTCRAIATPVGMSPCALNRSIVRFSPSR